MLQKISIQNLGLVQNLELDFQEGFTAITGETGAGKSFFCRGIELAMGARAKEKFSDKSQKTIIELEWNGKIFRRIFEGNKSRFFINDTPENLEEGQKIFAENFDMHSQHNNLFLKQKNSASKIFDSSLPNQYIVSDFQEKYKVYKQSKKQEENKKSELEKLLLQKDFLVFQSEKMEKIQFSREELTNAENILKNSNARPEIKAALEESINILAGEGNSVLAQLDDAQKTLQKFFPLEAQKIDIFFKEIPDLIESLENKIPEDDTQQEDAEKLVQKVEKWRREFGASSIEDLMSKKETIEKKLEYISVLEEEIIELEKNTIQVKSFAEISAQKLSQERNNEKLRFENLLQKKCKSLGMPAAQFKVDFASCDLGLYGVENLEFLFSANKNQSPAPLRKIASGGEIARITLALKNFWPAETTMIFDEIDTGVSGHIAEKMADEMKSLARDRQIFSITHLPQIAAKADHHLVVEKVHYKNETKTTIRKITGEERVEVIAKMLSGENVSEEARAAARKLLEHPVIPEFAKV